MLTGNGPVGISVGVRRHMETIQNYFSVYLIFYLFNLSIRWCVSG